ncbi:hypothetical protein V12B01_13515 [Vibrio splendidus 12B01]|nr:hypothetical protein V12B01_13515 [Vibrio splendidus 12B01]
MKIAIPLKAQPKASNSIQNGTLMFNKCGCLTLWHLSMSTVSCTVLLISVFRSQR